MRQSLDANDQHRPVFSTARALRLIAFILVVLELGIIRFFDVGQVGYSMQWKDGDTSISAGSHPAVLLWAAAAVALFVVLMFRRPGTFTEGVPTMKRRAVAFLIDFWFSLAVVSSVGAVLPIGLEALRTGHFAWQFQRNYSVSTDELAAVVSLVFMALMVLYFVFPLTRGRQTVGDFVMGLRVAPPFGDEGRFAFKAALVRTFYAFIGLASILTRKWDRDGEGRTWYDRKTNCAVRLVSDD